MQTLQAGLADPLVQWTAALLFAGAVLHTFAAPAFARLAERGGRHSGLLHLLGEIEIVLGFWAAIFAVFLFTVRGSGPALEYLEGRSYTEPLFVFAVMLVAASRPVLELAGAAVRVLARVAPVDRGMATYFLVLGLLPLAGSFITEPAAMTVAALILRDTLFARAVSERLKYATIGVLFVNVSIGGTLTPFAAPPVLMVAATWNWDFAFMLATFGWKAALAVAVNAALATILFRGELTATAQAPAVRAAAPAAVTLVHLVFLASVVVFAHHPVVFLGLLGLFVAFTAAYPQHQSPLIFREALLVACFLAGLVVLGGQQEWWLRPLLLALDPSSVFWGAAALTAITDNAALTYLGSLVEGLSDEFKVALVAGAVAGGGMTVIANAPNPAGAAILKPCLEGGSIRPLRLAIAALVPTLVAALAFRIL